MSDTNLEKMRECAQSNQFRAGAKAYLDAFHCGMIPCTVLNVKKPGFGFIAGQYDSVRIVVNADRPGYKRGEKLDCSPSRVVPRPMVRLRDGKYRVNTLYQWIPG